MTNIPRTRGQVREMNESDPAVISGAFAEQDWVKPVELYQKYYQEQREGKRVVLIAEADGEFAGYVTVVWESGYPFFREQGIPEVKDFNVLIKFRRRGVGTMLMDQAEEVIRKRASVAGIGVGVFSDYGNAQTLYVKRGYVPDGKGVHQGERYLQRGDAVVIDDDMALYLIKQL